MVGMRSLVMMCLMAGMTVSTAVSVEDHKSEDGLHVKGNLICNEASCYPKVFEATDSWAEVKPGQQLPGGLDIRMDFETGLKEAKLISGKPAGDLIVPAIAENAKRDQKAASHEFVQEFNTVRDLASARLIDVQEKAIEAKLDSLLEFAHDYKHGLEIITHEFDLLRNISFSNRFSINLRELSTRMIISCTRNNPRVVESINENHPQFVDEIFVEVKKLVHDHTANSKDLVLIKRYLSLLDELISDGRTFTQRQVETLATACEIPDKQIRIEVLELVSKLFTDSPDGAAASSKRDLEKVVLNVQVWADNLQKMIQDKDIDELHTRKFFNSLYNIKQEYKDVKIGSTFLNWLSRQAVERKNQLDSDLHERDPEQDLFDKRIVESRHLVFGNPMAHRMKNYDDEL